MECFYNNGSAFSKKEYLNFVYEIDVLNYMTTDNIKNILSKGEGLTIEFKRAKEELPQNLFETVCAFLNRNGGTILLGVNDDKTIEGVNPLKAGELCKHISNLSNNAQKLYPTFLLDAQQVSYNGKVLISIFVPISSQVHTCNNKIFDRGQDGDFIIIASEQIKNLYIRKSSQYSENTIYPYLYESDFEAGIVARVRKIIKIQRPDHPWNELTNEEFFRVSGLYRKDMASGLEGFTMSALLLFGKPETIGSALPHYKIDALLRIRDIERYDDREHIRCNLVDAYDKLIQFVAKHLPDKFYLEGDQRISLRDIIFREVVSNLLIHREYSNAFPSTFIIYRDRLEVKNANKPHNYGQLIPANFEPFPKNPHIAQIFTQMGRSEELGTGIRKVYKYSKAYSGNEHIEFIEQDIFTTIVPLDSIFNDTEDSGDLNEELNGGLNGGLNDSQSFVLNYIIKNEGVKAKDISEKLNIPIDTVDKHIRVLIQNNYIERRGSKKTGGYYIIIR